MGSYSDTLRWVSLGLFVWHFSAVLWKRRRGEDWHFSAFMALIFYIAATTWVPE